MTEKPNTTTNEDLLDEILDEINERNDLYMPQVQDKNK